jgi:serine/threonine protein kinase
VVKITDFGWSVRRDGRLRNTFCGTPVYLCPEILIGDDYDESVDIWTIGVILYEVIYRSNPFRITCKEELINILNEPIHFDPRTDISPPARDFI